MAEEKEFLDLAGLTRFKQKNDALYAPINDAELTGTPSAPTAAAGTNTTQLATTAFVQQEISGITHAIVPKASVAFASLPALADVNVGWMYNISDAFTTTADFVEGTGKKYGAGQNVVCVEYESGTKKWDVFSTPIDLTPVWAAIDERLVVADSMPATPENGDKVLYTGATGTYVQGRVYKYNATATEWQLVGNGMTPITTAEIDALFE